MKKLLAISLLSVTFMAHALKDAVKTPLDLKFLWTAFVAKEAFTQEKQRAVEDALEKQRTERQIEYDESLRGHSPEIGMAGACNFARYDGIVGVEQRKEDAILAGAKAARQRLETAGYSLSWNRNTLLYSVVEVAKQAEEDGLFKKIKQEDDSEEQEEIMNLLAERLEGAFKRRYAAMTWVAYVGLEKAKEHIEEKRKKETANF